MVSRTFWALLNFRPKLAILQRLEPMHGLEPLRDGCYPKSYHFSNIRYILEFFFARNNSNVLLECFFRMFLTYLIYDPNWPFWKGYSLCISYSLSKTADFQNPLISRIFQVLWSASFTKNNSKWIFEWILTCFLQFQFLTQSEDFAWAIAFAWWLIFKMVSFLEYIVFFRAVLSTQQLSMICRMDFDMFFGILIFGPKWAHATSSLWVQNLNCKKQVKIDSTNPLELCCAKNRSKKHQIF